MDFIRFCYETKMRFVEGQDGIKVRWQRARPGAKVPPFRHQFGSRVWEENWRGKADRGEFGEVYGSTLKWVEPQMDPHTCLDGPFWPEEYRPGVMSRDAQDFKAIRKEANGTFSGCCTPPSYVPLWPALEYCLVGKITPRLTQRLRVRSLPNFPFDCPRAIGTDFIIEREADGIWRGVGEYGTSGITMSCEFPVDCLLRLTFDLAGDPYVEFRVDDFPLNLEYSLNPPRIFNWIAWRNGVPNHLMICGPGLPLPSFRLQVDAIVE